MENVLLGIGYGIISLGCWGIWNFVVTIFSGAGSGKITGLRIVILDHFNSTIFTNMTSKGDREHLIHLLSMKDCGCMNYVVMPLTANLRSQIPGTVSIVERFENTYWFDIVGDIIPDGIG